MLSLRRRFGLVLGFGGSGFLLFCVTQVINYYREPWLGIEQGYAPTNFAFNLAFFIPSTLLSSGLALVSAIFYLHSLRMIRRNGSDPSLWERATILPAAPVLVFDVLLALFLGRIIFTS
jgi:hypothetical protein